MQNLIDNWKNNNFPEKYSLSNNYPNPFNPITHITYTVPKPSNVTIQIFNSVGQHIKTLVNEKNQARNTYKVNWDGLNDLGNQMASGIYFYRIQAGSFVKSKKMILLK